MEGRYAVVTGGCGFVGSHLVDALVAAGARVSVIDIIASSERSYANADAAYHQLDIRDTERVQRVLEGAHFVFHLAALASVQGSIDHPLEYHDTNVNGTLSILEAVRMTESRPRMISASSAAVYGNQEHMPVRESAPLMPQSPYALHKVIGERYCAMWHDLYGLETVVIRPFNIYGSRMPEEGPYACAPAKFLAMRKAGKPLTIFGDGEQTRDYIHVKDMAAAYMRAALAKDAAGEVINIGSGTQVTLNAIARLISDEIVYGEPRVEIRDSFADISRAKALLGWEPLISIEEGIDELKNNAGV